MLIIAPFALVLAGLGAALMALAPEKNPTAKEIGRAMLWAGLFAFAYATAQHVIHFW